LRCFTEGKRMAEPHQRPSVVASDASAILAEPLPPAGARVGLSLVGAARVLSPLPEKEMPEGKTPFATQSGWLRPANFLFWTPVIPIRHGYRPGYGHGRGGEWKYSLWGPRRSKARKPRGRLTLAVRCLNSAEQRRFIQAWRRVQISRMSRVLVADPRNWRRIEPTEEGEGRQRCRYAGFAS